MVVEDVYSQAEKRLRPAPVLYFKETKKGLVLCGTNQDALQTLFGDNVTACFGKRALLEPTLMRVAGREPTRRDVTGVIRLKAAPASNGTGPKATTIEKATADAHVADNGAEPRPEAMASN